MAWIAQCIFLVSLVSTHGDEVNEPRSLREGATQADDNPNGSYKILNRFVKPVFNKRVDSGLLIYPGLSTRTGSVEDPVIPESCKHLGICDEIPNYPEQLVAKLIQEVSRRNNVLFNKDVTEKPEIAERIGPDEENVDLCTSIPKLYAPRAAEDINSEWHVILNDKKDPQQTFRVEICQKKDSACSSIAFFQPGYKSICIQKFMLRNMIALNKKKEVVEKPFRVPSCCSCVARQTIIN